ncbi:MAG: hypothetical protein HY519_04135 [Candidatus Aenigmarchaeota archaeon]|nr:hypothetical protein [Candidatus Aenigmarchaeota archaeon]
MKVVCDHCKRNIISRKDFIAVGQLYPRFPYAKYHNACYSEFLKSGKLWIGARGQQTLSGPNAGRGYAFTAVFFLLWLAFITFILKPKLPAGALSDAVYYAFLALGVAGAAFSFYVKQNVQKLEKELK